MKRSMVALLIVVLLAGYLGTLIARDPGYVLVAYDGFTMQTSLWVLLAGLALIIASIYYLLLLLGVIRRSPLALSGWKTNRQMARARELHAKGSGLLAEGEAQRARKYLESAIEDADQPGLVMLEAARAADGMGDGEGREALLRRAEETDPGLVRARSVVAAELALARKDAVTALDALQGIKHNKYTVSLLVDALRAKSDWTEALQLLPMIRKVDVDIAQTLEEDMVLMGLSALKGNDTNVGDLYRAASREVRDLPLVVSSYVRSLVNRDEAEPVLRAAIKKHWLSDHVRLYGDLGETSLKTRRKTAEGWRKKHGDDASLHYCLGCIYEHGGEKSLAVESFTRSLELEEQPQTRERFARLLAQDGEFEKSSEQWMLAHGQQS